MIEFGDNWITNLDWNWAWSFSKQISKCNSPAPATICSPDTEILTCTQESDLDECFNPSTI